MEIKLDKAVDYELRMMKECRIKSLIPINFINLEDGVKILYEDGYERLINKYEILDEKICDKVIKTVEQLFYALPNYLLSPSKLKLDINDVMIDDDGNVMFIYVPKITVAEDFYFSLKKLIKGMLSYMEDSEYMLVAMQKMEINKQVGQQNVDYLFEIFK